MSEPDQPFQHMLHIEVPDEAVAGTYADFAAAWHTPDVFILDFATLKGAPQSVETESGPGVMSVARVVSRVRIPPAQVFELMKALEQQLSAWEKETGRRPDGNDGDLPPVL